MAIQVKRGSGHSSTTTLSAGQPYYDLANHTLYVSDADDSAISSISYGVTLGLYAFDSELNKNDWDQISRASRSGAASAIWSIGDTHSVALSGTASTLTLSTTLYIYIVGFNHNAGLEGDNTIHFQGFKTASSSGVSVGLIDASYGSTATDGTLLFNMNHWGNYNYGGWAACDMRSDILGSTNVAASTYGSARTSGDTGFNATMYAATTPYSNSLLSCIEEGLRAVMRPMVKYTDNVGGGTGHVLSNISATVDFLPLASPMEIFGATGYSNTYELNYQSQYEYFKNGNSVIKYRHSATTSAAGWWLRSPNYYSSGGFCFVSTSGDSVYYGAYFSYAVAPLLSI